MNRTALAMIVATLGTLAILAGNYGLIPRDPAAFLGTGLYIISGLIWWVPWKRRRSDRDEERS